MIITQHAKQRIVQRDDSVNTIAVAKRNAKIAYNSGYKIHELAGYCPHITAWMRRKKGQNGNDAKVRLYQNNLYIWRGKKKRLVTVLPLCENFQRELNEFNEQSMCNM